MQPPTYCDYFQATVARDKVWFLTAILRSYEHVCFDRTIDKATSTFEFFVPPDMREPFDWFMDYAQERGFVSNLQQMKNRLA